MCAAPLPSPSVMPWAKPSLSSWESHALTFSSSNTSSSPCFHVFCVLSHPSPLNLPQVHHILLLIFLKVFFFFSSSLCCCRFSKEKISQIEYVMAEVNQQFTNPH